MRPRLFTFRKVILALAAATIFIGLVVWLNSGAPLPFTAVPSTAGKILFVSSRGAGGHTHVFMADGKPGAAAAAITSGVADDRQAAWSTDGSEIAFISQNRSGVTPQVFTVDARPAANAVALTNTSSTKEQPHYAADRRIYYLASGKLLATTPNTLDTDQIFPAAVETKTAASLLTSGGVVAADVSPDGSTVAAALQLEQGQALLLYLPGQQQCVLLGVAYDRVLFHFLPDGKLLAVFSGGAPLPKPLQLYGPDQVKSALPAVGPLTLEGAGEDQVSLAIGPADDPGSQQHIAIPRAHVAVQFDADGKLSTVVPIGLDVTGLAVAADGSMAVITTVTPTKVPQGVLPPGVFTLPLPLQATAGGTSLWNLPATEPAVSADGKHALFVSVDDVYVAPTDNSTPAVDLTNGQGKSSAPAFSPAAAAK